MDRLLYLLETNPRLTNAELAIMLGVSEQQVEQQIKLYEESGVIKGYRAIIDKDKVHAQSCTALIEIKVHPKFGNGFDEVAEKIASLEEVESIYLVSGGYDLCCIVENKSFEEVAMFVVKRLSPIQDVVSTSTNFILKKYKEQGVNFSEASVDDRGSYSL